MNHLGFGRDWIAWCRFWLSVLIRLLVGRHGDTTTRNQMLFGLLTRQTHVPYLLGMGIGVGRLRISGYNARVIAMSVELNVSLKPIDVGERPSFAVNQMLL
jgi:hypothetical protein